MASALVDGEASEFECRRLLDGMSDPALRDLLGRHYTVRSLIRTDSPALCPDALSASIFDALAAEPAPGAGAVPRTAVPVRWRGWAGGAAVAASVCLVAVVGSLALQEPAARSPAAVASAAPLGSLGAPAAAALIPRGGAMQVGFGPAPQSMPGDLAAERRLQRFMVDHVQNAALDAPQGMMPFARVQTRQEP